MKTPSALTLAFIIAAAPAAWGQSPMTLDADYDRYTTAAGGGSATYAEEIAGVKTGASSGTYRSSIRFPVSLIPGGAAVSAVDLVVYTDAAVAGHSLNIYSIENEPSAATIANNYTDSGDGTNYVAGSAAMQTTGSKTISLGASAVTNLQTALDGSQTWWAVGLQSATSAGSFAYFASADNATVANRPKLVVTYTLVPKVTGVSPSALNSGAGIDGPTSLTVTGNNFTSGSTLRCYNPAGTLIGSATTAAFDPPFTTVMTFDSATQVRATLDPTAGEIVVGAGYDIKVFDGTTESAQVDNFEIYAFGLSNVSGIAPTGGGNDTTTAVTLTGRNFKGSDAGASDVVTLRDTGTDAVVATLTGVSVANDRQITATVPAGITIGTYNVKVQTTQGLGTTSATFQVKLPSNYYVNDAGTTNDVYCTAVGNDANAGTTPGAPKASFSNLLSSVALAPGDRIFVDTGTYADNWTLTEADDGASGDPVMIIGSTVPGGTVMRSASNVLYAIRIQGGSDAAQAQFVTVRNITFNANLTTFSNSAMALGRANNIVFENCRFLNGVSASSGPNDYPGVGIVGDIASTVTNTITILNCEFIGNSRCGVLIWDMAAVTVRNCSFYNNGTSATASDTPHTHRGAVEVFSGGATTTLRNNVIWANVDGTSCIATHSSSASTTALPAGWTSDYDDLFTSGTAAVATRWASDDAPTATDGTLATWQTNTAQDANSISGDPLFVNAAGSDLHLRSQYGHLTVSGSTPSITVAWTRDAGSTSPCIDAGSTSSPYNTFSSEPEDNGNRVNMGSHGNTWQASHSSYNAVTNTDYPDNYWTSAAHPPVTTPNNAANQWPAGMEARTSWNNHGNWAHGVPNSGNDQFGRTHVTTLGSLDPTVDVATANVYNIVVDATKTVTITSGNVVRVDGDLYTNNGTVTGAVDGASDLTLFRAAATLTFNSAGTTTADVFVSNGCTASIGTSNPSITGTWAVNAGAVTDLNGNNLTVNQSAGTWGNFQVNIAANGSGGTLRMNSGTPTLNVRGPFTWDQNAADDVSVGTIRAGGGFVMETSTTPITLTGTNTVVFDGNAGAGSFFLVGNQGVGNFFNNVQVDTGLAAAGYGMVDTGQSAAFGSTQKVQVNGTLTVTRGEWVMQSTALSTDAFREFEVNGAVTVASSGGIAGSLAGAWDADDLMDFNGNVTWAAGSAEDVALGTMTVAGNWDDSASTAVTFAGGTVEFDTTAAADNTVKQGSTNSFFNVTKTGASASRQIATGSAAVDVNGDFLLSAGTWDPNGVNMEIAGNFTQSGGIFQPASGRVVMDGTGVTQLVATTAGNYFYQLEVNGSSNILNPENNLTINSDLIVTSGTFSLDDTAAPTNATLAHAVGGNLNQGGGLVATNRQAGAGSTITIAGNLDVTGGAFDNANSAGSVTVGSSDEIIVGGNVSVTGAAWQAGTAIRIDDVAPAGAHSLSMVAGSMIKYLKITADGETTNVDDAYAACGFCVVSSGTLALNDTGAAGAPDFHCAVTPGGGWPGGDPPPSFRFSGATAPALRVFDMDGGTFTTGAAGAFNDGGGNGTVNLSGGTMTVGTGGFNFGDSVDFAMSLTGGTLQVSGAWTVQDTGDADAPTWSATTANTVDLNGTGAQTIAHGGGNMTGPAFGNLTVSAAGTTTLSTSIDVGGALNVTGGTFAIAGATTLRLGTSTSAGSANFAVGTILQTASGSTTNPDITAVNSAFPYDFNVSGTLDVDGLDFSAADSEGMNLASTVVYTNLKNVAFTTMASTGPTPRRFLTITDDSLTLDLRGMVFNAGPAGGAGPYNVYAVDTNGGDNVVVNVEFRGFGAGAGAGEDFDFDADLDNNGYLDFSDDGIPGNDESGAIVHWMYAIGSLQGYPQGAVDLSTFNWYATYTAVSGAGGLSYVMVDWDGDGIPDDAVSIDESIYGAIVGPVWWNNGGGSYWAYVGTVGGYLFRLSDVPGVDLSIAWSVNMATFTPPCIEVTSPVTSDGTRVYFGGREVGATYRLYAVQETAGAPSDWALQTPGPAEWICPTVFTRLRTAPGVGLNANTHLFAATDAFGGGAYVYKITVNTGVIAATSTNKVNDMRPAVYIGGQSIDTQRVLIGDLGGRMHMIDADSSGFTDYASWPFTTVGSSPIAVSALFDAVEERTYFGAGDGRIYVVEEDDGADGDSTPDNYDPPAAGGGGPYPRLFEASAVTGAPLFEGGMIYVGNADGKVFIVDRSHDTDATGPQFRLSMGAGVTVGDIAYLPMASPRIACTGSNGKTILVNPTSYPDPTPGDP